MPRTRKSKSGRRRSSETVLQKAIKEYLELRGCRVHRQNAGASFVTDSKGLIVRKISLQPAGTSDLIGCMPWGQFFALEVKLPGNTPTEPQWDYLKAIASLGGLAGWADSIGKAETFFEKGKVIWES